MTNGAALLYNARGLPFQGSEAGLTVNQATRLLQVLGAVASRSSIASRLGYSFGGDRDLYDALGYTRQLRYEDYYARYDRQDLAKAVIDRPVEDSWRMDPIVHDGDEESAFSKGYAQLAKEANLYHYLQRVDKIASLGRYGALIMGLDDLREGESPAKPATKAGKLLYLLPYTELSATISQWDRRPASPRFARPEIYSISTSLDSESGVSGIVLPSSASDAVAWSMTQLVHHSRVLHVVEDPLDSDVFGTPGLKAIFNRLQDLEKIVGGAGEMFWRGARKEMALIADKEANLDGQALAAVKDEVEAFIHEAQTFLRLQGMDVKTIAPAVADPASHVDVAVSLICAARGIPKRILVGSERGELASSQDEEAWTRRCDVRRWKHNMTQILRPFCDRMIELGIVPPPANGEYEVNWPDLDAPSEADRAKTAQALSAALASYANARKAGLVLPFEAYLREILQWNQKRMESVEKVVGRSFREIEEEAKAEAEARRQEIMGQKERVLPGTGEKKEGDLAA
ncbi:MAG: hypothetical protein A2139_14320 [Desulfobacca sp. RBG_16_60_12]|nr:MAG: hypothetical protein A2139_14320 [Desulfobacca sp. RBG_16_60_12]